MWILVAEALGALGLLIFIVWWTFGPAQRRERDAVAAAAREAAREPDRRANTGAPAAPGAPAAAAPDRDAARP